MRHVEAEERAREHEAHQHQARHRRERIGDEAAQALLHERRRNAEHRLGAEPGGEHRRRDDRRAEAPARDRVVRRAAHARGGVEPDRDREPRGRRGCSRPATLASLGRRFALHACATRASPRSSRRSSR